MKRVLATVLATGAVAFTPAIAVAAETTSTATEVPTVVRLAVSAAGLVLALLLLLEALGVRKVALGGAIAEKISYVVLAIVCLASSALVQWLQNFIPDVPAGQNELIAQVLVLAAMGLFAAYFYSVRSALNKYLTAMTGSERLADEAKRDAAARVADEEFPGA